MKFCDSMIQTAYSQKEGRWRRSWPPGKQEKFATLVSPAIKIPRFTFTCWRQRQNTGSGSISAQMPLNVMDAHFRSFAQLVVPRLCPFDVLWSKARPLEACPTVIL